MAGTHDGAPKKNFQRDRIPVLNHKFDSLKPADVGNLVGVADRGNGTVPYCHPCKFTGHQHGALNVDVGVSEAGHDVTLRYRTADFTQCGDAVSLDSQFPRIDTAVAEVDDATCDLMHIKLV